VTLTDVEGPVLTNLSHCVALNAEKGDIAENCATEAAEQGGGLGATKSPWDVGNCHVRLLDWESCLTAMDKATNEQTGRSR